MMKTRAGNAIIVHSKSNKEISAIRGAVVYAEKKNKELYKTSPPNYRIVVCDSEKDYLKETRYKRIGGCACVKWGKIIMLKPSLQKGLRAKNTLYHELNHIFFYHKIRQFKPIWYVEGVGLLNQSYYKPQNKWKKYLRSIPRVQQYLATRAKRYKKEADEGSFYILSYFCIKYLERRYGANELITFIGHIPRPYKNGAFWKEFNRQFKLTKKELVAGALQK